jgi:SAM-dependent methyltransferase
VTTSRKELLRLERRTFELGSQALYRDAALYEQLYVRRRDDVRFYVDVAKRYGGPVLELGAGSGRITLAVAAAGVSIVGVDSMASMLAHAKARLAARPKTERDHVKLIRGDLRRLRLTQRFPLIIAPFNVLQHTASGDELQRVLERCAALLAPGGRLVLDVLSPDLRALAQDPERILRAGHVTHPATKTRYALSESSHYDAATQIRTVHMFLSPVTGHGDSMVVPLAQRQIFPEELRARLAAAGLALEARFGAFDRADFDAASASQIVIARRRKG